MAQMILFKRHPFDPALPTFVGINPDHIVKVVALGPDATTFYHPHTTTNVDHRLDEVFYLINNEGEVVES